jgi:hypothetical protein
MISRREGNSAALLQTWPQRIVLNWMAAVEHVDCRRRSGYVAAWCASDHAATTLVARSDLISRMGGWPKKRLYSRLNWLTLS